MVMVSMSVDVDLGFGDGKVRLAGLDLVGCGDENVVEGLGGGTRVGCGGGENVVEGLGGGTGDDRVAEMEDLGGGDCKVAALELDVEAPGNVLHKKAAKSGRSARTQTAALH